ncbi:siderophore-interacting protein [Pseudoalteromonas sp.]|uniref:siderophore-interacting protein n=1 Tax=unclassified Pseudoalteromonas TaxID=194690 RepID=UPI003F98A451
MNNRTPIKEIDKKLDIIEHVNQDHTEELLTIAQSDQPQKNILSAKILDIFQEGVLVKVTLNNTSQEIESFIQFEIEGDLEEQILYLAYAAIVKQGRDFSGSGKHFFTITNKQKLTANMLRLTVKSDTPLPEYYPGYAYGFLLKSMKKPATKKAATSKKKHWSKGVFDRFFIWLMKHLSSQSRQKLLYNMNKNVRLYTLRKSWKSSDDAEFFDQGYIDIFTHGGSLGSLWSEALSVNDIIMSRSETDDKHPHLSDGQALLIADETAYPALAGILEHWQNPQPPHIVVISAVEGEQAYFDDVSLPQDSHIQTVVCAAECQGDEVLAVLEELETIDVVWAAFESESAKQVRHYLRNQRKIIGKYNHTKGYWRLKKA